MGKPHASAKPAEDLGPQEILETFVVEAGTAGILPTNEKKLLQFLGSQQFGFDFISNEVDWVTEKDTVAGGYSIADVWGALVLSVGKLRSFVVTAPIRLRGDLTRLRTLPTNTLTSS